VRGCGWVGGWVIVCIWGGGGLDGRLRVRAFSVSIPSLEVCGGGGMVVVGDSSTGGCPKVRRLALCCVVLSYVVSHAPLFPPPPPSSTHFLNERTSQCVHISNQPTTHTHTHTQPTNKQGAIEQSPSDAKQYRALTLANGLRVLLVSDPGVLFVRLCEEWRGMREWIRG
jgi:hypothetical protein